MTSKTEKDELDLVADRVEEACRLASVADSLDHCWRKQLIEPLRSKPHGTAVGGCRIVYGIHYGWLTLLRENGIRKVCFWSLELNERDSPARTAITTMQGALESLIPRERMQIRGTRPFEWLALKGMPTAEIARLRAG